MIDKQLNLETLLPHRAPMILLDQALDYGEDFASAQVLIHADSRFYDPQLNGVPSWVGMEYMAQTMGVWAGSQQLNKHQAVQIAFLLGSRHYQCSQPVFASGTRLLVQCKVLFCAENGVGAFECEIKGFKHEQSNESIINASARINAFLPKNSDEFLRSEL